MNGFLPVKNIKCPACGKVIRDKKVIACPKCLKLLPQRLVKT